MKTQRTLPARRLPATSPSIFQLIDQYAALDREDDALSERLAAADAQLPGWARGAPSIDLNAGGIQVRVTARNIGTIFAGQWRESAATMKALKAAAVAELAERAAAVKAERERVGIDRLEAEQEAIQKRMDCVAHAIETAEPSNAAEARAACLWVLDRHDQTGDDADDSAVVPRSDLRLLRKWLTAD